MPGSQLPEPPDWGISVDKLGHFGLFAIWSILLLFAYSHKNPQYSLKNLLSIVTFGVLYGLLLETGQLWVPGREFSWPDMAANSSGSLLGALGFWTMAKFTSKLV